MNPIHIERRLVDSTNVLRNQAYDFSAKYMALGGLQGTIQDASQPVVSETISVLSQVLLDPGISRQTQSFFLFKEAAGILCSIIRHAKGSPAGRLTHDTLADLLGVTKGASRRALAEAVGGLPTYVKGPDIGDGTPGNIPELGWEDLLREAGLAGGEPPVLLGRSLVMKEDLKDEIVVLKFARTTHSLDALMKESLWTSLLLSRDDFIPFRFDIPIPLTIAGSHVFRLKDLPRKVARTMDLHGDCHAICFKAHPQYYHYPNGWRSEGRLKRDTFKDVMFRNGWLFGKLNALGIVHSAPIPLFHNRVQGARRPDGGLYEWSRGGRLDRWLDSCAYPNFGLTGIRDFEHFNSAKGSSNNLYQDIGGHLLGLFLVAGSWFRNEDPNRVGLDGQGRPVDARDLFDRDLFQEVVQGIFYHFYEGFVGQSPSGELAIDWQELTTRMVEEMGVDRHMEEVLRVVDQNEMDEKTFGRFFSNRGYTDEAVSKIKKGEADITLLTGPHLGGFNQRISLPELTEAIASMSAHCVLAKHMGGAQPSD